MIIQTPKFEPTFSQCYVFKNAGDSLPMHKHTPELEHRVRCVRGRVKVYGPWGEQTLAPGDEFQHPRGQEHCVLALEDETETEHTYVLGIPENYKKLTVEQLSGVIP